MANNAFIGLGIIGILSTGSVAVVANTQSLVGQDSSTLLDASAVLLDQEELQSPTPGITVPSLESPAPLDESLPADSATPQDAQAVTPTPTVTPDAVVAPATPSPAPVDATSSGSAYSDDDDYDDDDHDDDDHDDDDDDDDDDYDDDDD